MGLYSACSKFLSKGSKDGQKRMYLASRLKDGTSGVIVPKGLSIPIRHMLLLEETQANVPFCGVSHTFGPERHKSSWFSTRLSSRMCAWLEVPVPLCLRALVVGHVPCHDRCCVGPWHPLSASRFQCVVESGVLFSRQQQIHLRWWSKDSLFDA